MADRDVEFNYTASDKTGPAAESVKRRMRETGEKVEKDLGSSVARGVVSAANLVSPKLGKQLTGAFSFAAENGGALLASAGVAAAPLIAATLSAAVIGGAGIGGVIGGIMLVKDDPRVKGAGKQLGVNLLSSLHDDADVFVEPVLASIGEISDQFEKRLRPKIQATFANSAKFVAPLTDGAIRGVDGILRGIESLTAKGKPVMDQLGQSIGDLGEDAGQMLDTIAGGSESAAQALKDVTDNAGRLLIVTGYLVRGLTEVYGVMDKIGVTTMLLGPAGFVLDAVGRSSDNAAQKTGNLQKALDLAKTQWENNEKGIQRTNEYLANSQKLMDDAAQAARNLTSANQSLYDSETSLGAAIDRATASRKENGRTLDANTAKGRANRDALSGVAKAAQSEYDAFVKVNGQGPKSAALAETLRGKFIALAQKLGASSSQAQDLANKILGIPSKKDVAIKADASNAIAASKEAKRQINSVNSRSVTLTVNVNASRLASVEARLNRLHGGAFDAGDYWSAIDSNSGSSRTGGARAVEVSNYMSVSLDGRPFYDMTAAAVTGSERRQAWRSRVGPRSKASAL